MKQKLLLWLGLLLALGVPNLLIVYRESQLRGGQVAYLKLAPADPRSIMQGDYMALNYELGRHLSGDRGTFIARLGPHDVLEFVRLAGEPGPGEYRLRYRRKSWRTVIGTDAFFFQEGQADRYRGAVYGKVRLQPSGEPLLTGLADDKFQDL